MKRHLERARAAVIAATFVALASACSRGERAREAFKGGSGRAIATQVAAPASSAPRAPNEAASAGCGKAGAATGTLHQRTTDGSGTSRQYQVLVPSSYDARKPLALTFVYHGSGGTDDGAKSMGLQTAPGAADSSIFVFPQGIAFEHYGVGWNDLCSGYDMVLFDHMLEELTSSYCIDERRVFAAGFSWGGDHVTTLACCRGSRVRAIAPASCTDEFADATNERTYANAPCPSSGTTAIRFTFDPAGDSGYSAQQFKTTSALYRGLNGCSAASGKGAGPCASYSGCAQPFLECAHPGLGHTVPAGWANDTWAFFASLSPATDADGGR